jgi:hypothetical protein
MHHSCISGLLGGWGSTSIRPEFRVGFEGAAGVRTTLVLALLGAVSWCIELIMYGANRRMRRNCLAALEESKLLFHRIEQSFGQIGLD